MKNLNKNNKEKKYNWVADFIKYELEGRTEDEQIELLEEFLNQTNSLLIKKGYPKERG